MDNNVGRNIKLLREKNKYSQNDLAKLTFTTRQAISSWENGNSVPTNNNLENLAKVFDVTIDELFSDEIKGKEQKDKMVVNYKRIKKILLILVVIFLSLSLLFLLYYFIVTYKQIKVYKLSSDYSNIDGVFVVSKEKSYMHVVVLDDVDKVALYYRDNLIYQSDDDYISFQDIYGYDEYFSYNSLEDFIDNTYLEVYQNNKSYKSKLIFDLDFENKAIFFPKHEKISYPSDGNVTNVTYEVPEYVKNNFIFENDNYYLDVKDGKRIINISYMSIIDQFVFFEESKRIIYYFYNHDGTIVYQKYDGNIYVTKGECNINDNNKIAKDFKNNYYKYIGGGN